MTPTEKPQRMIEDFSRGLHDWVGNLSKKSWHIETRKLVDPRWMGPKDGELVIEVKAPAKSWIGVNVMRRFKSQSNGQFRYYAYFQLEKEGWNTLRMKPVDFENVYGEKLDDWHKVIILRFSDAESLGRDHKKRADYAKGKGGIVASIPSNVSSWDSSYYQLTDKAFAVENVTVISSKVDRFRNLRWEGGEYVERSKHWQKDVKARK